MDAVSLQMGRFYCRDSHKREAKWPESEEVICEKSRREGACAEQSHSEVALSAEGHGPPWEAGEYRVPLSFL